MNNQNSNIETRPSITPMPPQLKDVLRRKINLSQRSWDHLNDKWHDEIYISRRGDPFKKYRSLYPLSKLSSVVISDKVISDKVVNLSPPSPPLSSLPPSPSSNPEEDTLINKLENEIIDLKLKVITLGLVNIGLVIFHTLF